MEREISLSNLCCHAAYPFMGKAWEKALGINPVWDL
jgi:hypothetical protein